MAAVGAQQGSGFFVRIVEGRVPCPILEVGVSSVVEEDCEDFEPIMRYGNLHKVLRVWISAIGQQEFHIIGKVAIDGAKHTRLSGLLQVSSVR